MADTENNEAVTDVDALEKSLDALVKAAGATDTPAGKGSSSELENAVSTSGRVDEDGYGNSGMAGRGDIGGFSQDGWETKMMVAKMTELLSAGAIAPGPNFVAFANGEFDEDEGEDDEEMAAMRGKMLAYAKEHAPDVPPWSGKADGGFTTDLRPEPSAKSEAAYASDELRKSLSDPEVRAAIDASDFMQALMSGTVKAIDRLGKSLGAHQHDQSQLNKAQATAIYEIGTIVKSVVGTVNALGERLNLVERTPNAPKGQQTLSGAQAMSKSVRGEASDEHAQALTKSQAVSTLSYMALKKGIADINGHKTLALSSQLESGDVITPQTLDAVNRFLATHPAEAEQAKSYS